VLGNGDFHLRTDGIFQVPIKKNQFYFFKNCFHFKNDSAPVSTVIWSIDSKYLLAIYTDNDYNICKYFSIF
jgi:hypothetical protein